MQVDCYRAWAESGEFDKACGLDRAFPQCKCEANALRLKGGVGVSGSEKLARVFTDPTSYTLSASAIVGAKITSVYSAGLSTIRQGASDQEIYDTIATLLSGGEETQTLVGAAVFETSVIREFYGSDRWFGVYATDDGNKQHHADVLGTCPQASKSQLKKLQSRRRNELRKMMEASLIYESDPADLVTALRTCGI